MKLARIVLAVLGTLFVVQGAVQLFQPELLTDAINIAANSVTGRIELQVMYGGLHVALGAICLWGAVTANNTRAALTAMFFVSLGVAVPRLGLGLFHQDFSAYSLAAMTMESVAVVLLIGLLRSTRPTDSVLSFRLRVFNLVLRISSYLGLSKLHHSENVAEGLRLHSKRSDDMIARFTKSYRQPLIKTEHSRWWWVGDWRTAKRHILYLHGGGFCADMPATFRYWADRLATHNDAAVLQVDYPLAPESPYPMGLNVCLDAYRWMIEEKNIDPQHIIVGGDSAGGNLAMATMLKIKQSNLPMPACAFALSPCMDLTLSGASMTENTKSDTFGNKSLLEKLAMLYAPDRNFSDGFVSPLFGEFKNFPPIQLHVSAAELLRDDSVRFYEKFKGQTSVELVMWEGVPHCHPIFGFLPEAQLARSKLQSFIAKH